MSRLFKYRTWSSIRAFKGEITTTILVPLHLLWRTSAMIGTAWKMSDFPYEVGRLMKTFCFEKNVLKASVCFSNSDGSLKTLQTSSTAFSREFRTTQWKDRQPFFQPCQRPQVAQTWTLRRLSPIANHSKRKKEHEFEPIRINHSTPRGFDKQSAMFSQTLLRQGRSVCTQANCEQGGCEMVSAIIADRMQGW